MKDLVDTTEMYLRTVYELEEEGITPLRARIAERLEQSGPTVSQTVARMERDGLIIVASDRSLKLTDEGRDLAVSVMRKHRLAERLLTDIIGIDASEVHQEACRWEHVMGTNVEKRLVQILDNATTSPFGNPIPGLEEIGGTTAASTQAVRLIDLPEGDHEVTVASLAEIIQVSSTIFARLCRAEIGPGTTITASVDGGLVRIAKGEVSFDLPEDLSHAITVYTA